MMKLPERRIEPAGFASSIPTVTVKRTDKPARRGFFLKSLLGRRLRETFTTKRFHGETFHAAALWSRYNPDVRFCCLSLYRRDTCTDAYNRFAELDLGTHVCP
jgi:hypothetical protein